MRNIEARYKANIYRTYAEYLRLQYQAQRSRNPMGADSNLLDRSIQKWKRLQSMSSGNSRDAADARKNIEKLQQMKLEANSP